MNGRLFIGNYLSKIKSQNIVVCVPFFKSIPINNFLPQEKKISNKYATVDGISLKMLTTI